jgi:phospholipid-binding lipoprotein MlaA
MPHSPLRRLLPLILLAVLASGCATARDPRDPWETVNRATYGFNETVDKTIVKPVAMGYKFITPAPIRTWVYNFFSNLNDVVVLANDVLQFKFVQARDDFARILINSTWGLAGINDIASLAGLEKHNEDMGQSFGRWGMGPGPYFVIPLIGPSTVRDTAGFVGDAFIAPIFSPDDISTRNLLIALRVISGRAELLDAEKILEEAAIDEYAFVRDAYLQRRLNLIHDGKPPREYDDTENGARAPDPAPAAPSTTPRPSRSFNSYEPREPSFQPPARTASASVQRLWLPGSPK